MGTPFFRKSLNAGILGCYPSLLIVNAGDPGAYLAEMLDNVPNNGIIGYNICTVQKLLDHFSSRKANVDPALVEIDPALAEIDSV